MTLDTVAGGRDGELGFGLKGRTITPDEFAHLEALSKCSSSRVSKRAAIILLWSRGERKTDIARATGISRQAVARWIERYRENGLQGLRDKPSKGRRQRYRVEDILSIVSGPPSRLGLPFKRWTVRNLARYLSEEQGYEIKRSRIWQLLSENGFSFSSKDTD